MNHIMTFLLFFSPKRMIYTHHLMLGVRPCHQNGVRLCHQEMYLSYLLPLKHSFV